MRDQGNRRRARSHHRRHEVPVRSDTRSPTPDQIDYVIGQLTGGIGREVGKLAQTVVSPLTGDELPAHKIPLLGRLYGNTRGAAGQSAGVRHEAL